MYSAFTDPANDQPTPLRKVDSIDSVVIMRLDSSASSSYTFLRQDTAQRSVYENDQEYADSVERGESGGKSIGLEVTIRFGRLAIVVAVAVCILVGVTLTFNQGVVLGHFDPKAKGPDAQKKLLDDYNSYTGNIVSLFGRPIEIFVALTVHVVLLRVLATSHLRTEISWKTDALTLTLGAGAGYMISNGLNALNVQFQPPLIEPVISAADLSYVPDFSASGPGKRSTNLTHTFPEQSVRNPITNTVLRNLVLPPVLFRGRWCDWKESRDKAEDQFFPDLVAVYGFPQRDWQSRLLPEAFEPKTLRLVVNPTNKTANSNVTSEGLPMDASVAADLFVLSMSVARSLFPWGQNNVVLGSVPANFEDMNDNMEGAGAGDEDEEEDNKDKDGEGAGEKEKEESNDGDIAKESEAESLARIQKLLPPTTSQASETAQREWFLRESANAMASMLEETTNTSQSDIIMEFSRVDISPTVRFDAFTIEIEVDPARVAQGTINKTSTRFNNVDLHSECGPWPMRCMLPKPRFTPTEHSDGDFSRYDTSSQVRVFASCVNFKGTEDLIAMSNATDWECRHSSNTSLMVVSIGKRFVADSITQNKTANASGYFDDNDSAVVTSLRRFYTYTMAKLSWELSDLAVAFSAKCATGAGSCKGLRFPLVPTGPDSSQELIVGEAALPLDLVELPTSGKPSYLPLVRLGEPSPDISGGSNTLYDAIAGDPLLPHNIAEKNWDMDQPKPDSKTCNAFAEQRLDLILNNHMYIEHGLQTAYTAATFFLMQNGVVKDVVELNATQKSLNFLQNTQTIALLASIPDQNARLTFGGCAVLVISLCSVLAWAWDTSKTSTGNRCGGLGRVTKPHVVARVMMDSTRFPPMFLHRRVIGASGREHVDNEYDGQRQALPTIEGFVINRLQVQPLSETNRRSSTVETSVGSMHE